MKLVAPIHFTAFCLSAILAAACCLMAAPAHAQPQRGVPTVDCNRSFLAMNPALTCTVPRGVINDNKAVTKDYYTAGILGGNSVYMALTLPPFLLSIKPYVERDSVNLLKNLNDLTRRQGRDWSAIRSEGNSSYMSFKTEREDCIAFDHAGPLKEGGYAWALRGYLCAPSGQPISFATVKPYLAATRVGNTRDNLNAYGQPVRSLASRP